MRKLIPILLILCTFSMANAAIYTWDNEAGDGLWSSALNWSADVVPGAGDGAIIDSNDVVIDINVVVNEIVLNTSEEDANDTASLTISGVTVEVTNPGTVEDEPFLINYGGAGKAVVNINSGAVVNVADDGWRSGDNGLSETTFNITGPDTIVTSTDNFRFADHGIVNVNITAGAYGELSDFRFGDNNDGFCNLLIEGSEIKTDSFQIGDDGAADVTIKDTTLFADEFSWNGRRAQTDSRLNLENALAVFTDEMNFANDAASDGGDASLFVETSAGSTLYCRGTLRMVNEGGHPVEVNLVEGIFAGNEVEFGESASWLDMEFDAGSFYAGGNRIVDINNLITLGAMRLIAGSTSNLVGPEYMVNQDITFIGGVPDLTVAHSFAPYNQMVDSIPGSSLEWLAGSEAETYDVYWGSTNPPSFFANTASTSISVPSAPSGIYYYKVDTVKAGETVTGDVIKYFATEGKAKNPNPGDGDDIAPGIGGTVAQWSQGGPWVAQHDIYLGTDEDDVEAATTSDTEFFKTNTGNGANTVDFGVLALDTTYYWKIDEKSTLYLVPGDVWSFSTLDYYLVDDFESYTSSSNLENTWRGYSFDPSNNGAEVFLDTEPAFVRSGDQSMDIAYDQSANYSTVERTYASSQNWTLGDVKGLVLYFFGASFNDVETQYVRLTDASSNSYDAAYPGSADDILVEDWTEWNAELQDFADNGVSLTAVKKVAITYSDNVGSAYGLVTYDDIRLYRVRCVTSLSALTADLTGDCIVDSDDLEEMSGDWLKEGLGNVTATTPDSGKLELQWTFDSDVTTGSTIADSTANGNDGTFVTDPNGTTIAIGDRIEVDGVPSNSFHLKNLLSDSTNGYTGIKIPAAIFDNMTDEATVSLWLKNTDPSETSDGGVRMWGMRYHDTPGSDDDGNRILAVECDDQNGSFNFRDDDENVEFEVGDWYTEQLEWAHYIFARDADNLTIYKNGVIVEQTGSSGNAFETPNVLFLGCDARRQPNSGQDELNDGFLGNVDDFRIYSYSVSAGDALSLAGEASHYYDIADGPIYSGADIYDDNKIELKDYSVLAGEWLDEDMWP